jgi:hypothetical protein
MAKGSKALQKRASSFEIRAFHNGIYNIRLMRCRMLACMHTLYAHKRGRSYVHVRWHTYHVSAHYVWARTFRPAYGRE